MLVAVLPLEEAQRVSNAKQAQQQSPAQGAAQAAGAAAAARASGSQPAAASLSREMLRLGEWVVSLTFRHILHCLMVIRQPTFTQAVLLCAPSSRTLVAAPCCARYR